MSYATYLQEYKTTFDGKSDVDFNYSMKLDFGSSNIIHLDDTGSSCVISDEDKAANVTLKMSEDTWEKLKTKELGGAQAFAEDKIIITGDIRIIFYTKNIFDKITT
jgi:putative sterol carrier protein